MLKQAREWEKARRAWNNDATPCDADGARIVRKGEDLYFAAVHLIEAHEEMNGELVEINQEQARFVEDARELLKHVRLALMTEEHRHLYSRVGLFLDGPQPSHGRD